MGAAAILIVLLSISVGRSYADINKDKQECTAPLMALATCLPYVGGQAKAPTQDCCTGIKQVLKENKRCICILVKDRNDPSVNIKINASLALSLPQTCHSSDTLSVPQCLGMNETDSFFFNLSISACLLTPYLDEIQHWTIVVLLSYFSMYGVF